MLPTFLCLGAQKCGTTSLWRLLDAHPDICMARPRETRFFSEPTQYSEGAATYERRHFAHWSGQAAVGEKCPEYLEDFAAASRIRDTLGPEVRLIVSLRNPAQRAFSHYRHNRARLRECRSFDDAIEAELRADERGDVVPPAFAYLGRGRYASRLAPYFRLFPREQFLMVHFEAEIESDQRALASSIYAFLGVRPFVPRDLPYHEGHPQTDAFRCALDERDADPARHFVEFESPRRHGVLATLSGPARDRVYGPSRALRHFVIEYERTRTQDTRLPADRAAALNRQQFHNEILNLQSVTSFDLAGWLDLDAVPVTR